MGLVNLRKSQLYQSIATADEDNHPELQRLKGVPFYIWNESEYDRLQRHSKGLYTFNELIGLPRRDQEEMPLMPYQQELFELLQHKRFLWIKKARGIGMSEFYLRFFAYNIFNVYPPHSRICILVGPRQSLAEDLIDRFKGLFQYKLSPALFDRSRSTEAVINTMRVSAIPSFHSQALRSLDMVKAVYVDEAAYIPAFQQREIRSAAEGFLAKPNSTDLHIIFVSTPAAPTGMFYDMEREEPSLYFKKVYDYRYGLQGSKPIYLESAIEQAKKSADWGREYLGLYSGIIGNCFSIASIDRDVALGTKYNVKPESWHKNIHTILAIDPAYSAASKYGIVMTQYLNGEVVVIYAKAFTKPDYSEMINEVFKLSRQVGGVSTILVDSSAPEVIVSIRRAFRKDQYSETYLKEIVDNAKKSNIPLERRLFVVPKNFREGKQMLQHAVELLDEPGGLVAIPAVHEDLITGLRTAVADEWDLDKKKSVNSDLIDAWLMCLSVYKFSK